MSAGNMENEAVTDVTSSTVEITTKTKYLLHLFEHRLPEPITKAGQGFTGVSEAAGTTVAPIGEINVTIKTAENATGLPDWGSTSVPQAAGSTIDPTREIDVIIKKTEEATGLPDWGILTLFILIAILILGCCLCCIRRWYIKQRAKYEKKGMKGVDLQTIQLLDMDELSENEVIKTEKMPHQE